MPNSVSNVLMALALPPPMRPGRLARWPEAAFWWGAPPLFLAILLQPAVHVTDPVAALPYAFPATVLAIALQAPVVAIRRFQGRRATFSAPAWLPSCFVPTYLWGIEATKHLAWTMRCHGPGHPPDPASVVAEAMLVSGAALLATVIAGGTAALLLGHRHVWRVVPPVVGAIVASVVQLWWSLWRLVTWVPS